MTAVEIVGNLYIRNQVLEEQFNQAAVANQQLTQIVTAFKSKEYAQRLAEYVLGLNGVTPGLIDYFEKALNDPKLLIPDVIAADVEVPEAIALLDQAIDPKYAEKAGA